LFKLLSDTFLINEIIDSNTYEALLENEITISDDLDIGKIISTEAKAKINSSNVLKDKIAVNGDLIYNIIYRSNDEDMTICSKEGKIPFSEEISVPGAHENMEATVTPFIDYVDSELLPENTVLVKAVVNLDFDVENKHPVSFISSFDSNGSFQAKSRNADYTDVISQLKEELNVNDAIELNKNSNGISKILKTDADAYITNVDIMNERMLVEGILKVGFLFTEDDGVFSTGFVSEEFPFTHYFEIKNSSEDMLRDVEVVINDLTYNTVENNDDEKKLIEFNADLMLKAVLYDTVGKNLITDAYSTEVELDTVWEDVNLTSLKNIKSSTMKYENNFDVTTGTIKDVYTVDISPKISEKRVVDNKFLVDGFLDVNLLYLNGEINKLDKAYASMPFTASMDLSEDEKLCDIYSNVTINRCSAYRKGSNSIMISCDIKTDAKLKRTTPISIISNITEVGLLDKSKQPSLIFRVVQNGETLWDIAKNYNVSMNYLKEINDISQEEALTPGTKVIVAKKV
jgi:hypothetical protein